MGRPSHQTIAGEANHPVRRRPMAATAEGSTSVEGRNGRKPDALALLEKAVPAIHAATIAAARGAGHMALKVPIKLVPTLPPASEAVCHSSKFRWLIRRRKPVRTISVR